MSIIWEFLRVYLAWIGAVLGTLGIAVLIRFYLSYYDVFKPKPNPDRVRKMQEEIRKMKLEYERKLRLLHERARMYEAIHDALARNKIIMRCAEHPNSPIMILPDGTIICQEGKHRIWPLEEGEGGEEINE